MDVFDYSAIGQRIKTLRKSKGLNQQDLANLLGKSLRTVQKYETGEIEVSIAIVNELAKLLDKLGVDLIELEPITQPIRGGTDGARLSFMGLPCPNIFAGGLNFHGRHEFLPIQSMEKAMQTVVNICRIVAEQ